MFINFDLLFKKGLDFEDLGTLLQINQKESILLEGKDFTKFEELKLVMYLKNSKEKHISIRLSKEGKGFLDALSTKGLTEEIGILAKEIAKIYEDYGKDSGNFLEFQKRLIWFIEETGFGPKAIKDVIEKYVIDSGDWTLRLDNLVWKGQSIAFSVHYNLKDSKLFDLVIKQYNLLPNFFINPTRSAEEIWLQEISKIVIPKKLPEDLYFTGNYKSDKEIQDKLKKKFQGLLK